MSPSSEDALLSPEAGRPGGLVGVFKGLTGAKSIKSPPPQTPTSATPSQPFQFQLAETFLVARTNVRRDVLSPHHIEALEKLRNGTPNERIASVETLRYVIAEYTTRPVLDIWEAGKDLIDPAKSTAARIAGWELMTECAKHPSSTDLERKVYFETLAAPANPSDFHLQMAALVDLTKDGRDLSGFEYDVIPLLAMWLTKAYSAVRTARKKVKGSPTIKVLVSGEENNLAQLFKLVIDVVKFCFNVADDPSVGRLVNSLLDICMNTTVEADLRICIRVIDAIVTYGNIPSAKLRECIHVLSTIFCKVPGLEKDSWHTISTLLWSHNGQAIIRILLDVLRNQPTDPDPAQASRKARSALVVLQRLLSASPDEQYPTVPLSLLVDGLTTVIRATSSNSVIAATVGLLNSLFNTDGEDTLNTVLTDEDWSPLLDVAVGCCKKYPILPSAELESRDDNRSSSTLGGEYSEKIDKVIRSEIRNLICRFERLVAHPPSIFVSSSAIIKCLVDVHSVLPDSAANVVLAYFHETRCCCPPDLQWRGNLALVQDVFFKDRGRSLSVRLKALQVLTDAIELYDLTMDGESPDLVSDIVRELSFAVTEETEIPILESIVTLMEFVASFASIDVFNQIVDGLMAVLFNDRLRSPITPSPISPPVSVATVTNTLGSGQSPHSPSNVVTLGFVRIFLTSMARNAFKATQIFTQLVIIARSRDSEVNARLTAMRLLFRLRADWNGRIHLTADLSGAEHLSALLHRTDATLLWRQADTALPAAGKFRGDPQSRPSRVLSSPQSPAQHERVPTIRSTSHSTRPPALARYQPLWLFPDADPVLRDIPTSVSPVLLSSNVSHVDGADGPDADAKRPRLRPGTLNMASWLDAVTNMLARGLDWEGYSFVLVHLHLQISNHAIFQGAIPQIRELRRLICELIRQDSFQEPPKMSGLRRADVIICLFNTLTIILSYHEHFQKAEEDEIVNCFFLGLDKWERSARCCIHALSICCHELPLSVGRWLIRILDRMSAIITQPRVAVHILEFLAGLSRFPELFVNFREKQHQIVFGICFRYLQTRDKKQPHRNIPFNESSTSLAGGNGSDAMPSSHSVQDDLPQYVYALAYHVILFWFIALKLPDRPTHVGWIAKNLFADLDAGMPGSEEQALTTMDFMQRVTFADIDEPLEAPLLAPERSDGVTMRRWIIDNGIVTISQADDKSWAQIVRRQPSCTSSYVVRESMALEDAPSDGQGDTEPKKTGTGTGNVILPSHLLVQLISTMPQMHEALRPIALPDDAAVDRAIWMLDLKSTVDGHKVGVIYVAEGQTAEVEILANTFGSSDYVALLSGLGTLTRLKGAKFNTQGLDRKYDQDGKYTLTWRDRIMRMVFHVTTQMPTDLQRDPQCGNKKKHIGNDYVNIIFNDSGLPFRFDTFPSEFNYVNIVITPDSRASFLAGRSDGTGGKGASAGAGAGVSGGSGGGDSGIDTPTTTRHSAGPRFQVRVMSKPGFPEVTSASETKVVSLRALPHFVRLLALNASVFSLVWANRDGGEHVGNWRSRLHDIRRLRERYGGAAHYGDSGSSGGRAAGPASATPNGVPSTAAISGAWSTPGTASSAFAGAGGAAAALSGGGSGGAPHPAPPPTLPPLPPSTAQQPHHSHAASGGGGDGQRAGAGVRDSFGSLRRTSTTTFLTTTSEQTSHRSSMMSSVTNDTEMVLMPGIDPVVESVDFSKWA